MLHCSRPRCSSSLAAWEQGGGSGARSLDPDLSACRVQAAASPGGAGRRSNERTARLHALLRRQQLHRGRRQADPRADLHFVHVGGPQRPQAERRQRQQPQDRRLQRAQQEGGGRAHHGTLPAEHQAGELAWHSTAKQGCTPTALLLPSRPLLLLTRGYQARVAVTAFHSAATLPRPAHTFRLLHSHASSSTWQGSVASRQAAFLAR